MVGEAFDVVARLFGGRVEGGVRQDQRGREVVGDADAGEGVGGRAGLEVLGGEPVDVLSVFQQGELGGHAEGALAGAEPWGEVEGAGSVGVVVEVFAGLGGEADAVVLGESCGEGAMTSPGRMPIFSARCSAARSVSWR